MKKLQQKNKGVRIIWNTVGVFSLSVVSNVVIIGQRRVTDS